jgi:hypothetical protein
MNALNGLFTALTDWFFSLWVDGPAWLPLVVVSAVAGMFTTIVFRFTSRQSLLRRDAELIQAQLLAMKLFRDDLGTLFGSLGQLLRYTAQRLWHSLPPVVVMIVPFILLLAQLARWYEHAPLVIGDQAVVILRLSERAWHQASNVSLEVGDGFAVETSSLCDSQEHAIYWRIRITEPRPATLRWSLPQQTVEMDLAATDDPQRLMAVDSERPGPGWISRLLHPGEPGFHHSEAVRGIEIHYPKRSTPILGVDLPWWATFLVLSMLTAVLVGRTMKVQF